MRLGYLDPASGVSGDLLLGALVDAGAPLDELQDAVRALGVDGLTLDAAVTSRNGVAATKVEVTFPEQHEHRRLRDVLALIAASGLPPRVRDRAAAVFRRLAVVEAAVHGTTPEAVHFHEVGAADALADIVGAVVGLDALGIDRLLVGAVNVGAGHVLCAHGRLEVPAPATAGLLRGWACYAAGPRRELTTPTGAAVVTTLGEQATTRPALWVERAGCGAADSDPPGWTNVLRLIIGQARPPSC